MKARQLDVKGREVVIQMLSAGSTASAVSRALETEGFGKWSADHIRRHYGKSPEVLKAREAARAAVVEQGVADRTKRVETLWNRAQWVDKAIAELSMSNPQPAVLKTLLAEFREYSKQVAQELGEWQERKDVTSGGKSITFNMAVLSTVELADLERLRSKLDSVSDVD